MTGELHQMGILIVDDDEDIRVLMAAYLQRFGYQRIWMAATEGQAVAILNDADIQIDLFLMDIHLRDHCGISLCGSIRERPEHRDTPIIMVSASVRGDAFEESFEAGATDYIAKPFNKLEFRVRIRAALRYQREVELRKARERELEILSAVDGLTEIANRRFFEQTLEKEWRRARRSGASLGLVMIDVDFFKQYNDHFGHLAGDTCLKAVATALAGAAQRGGDLVARYGGEEFVAILPGANESQVAVVAERMRQAVAALGIPHPLSSVSSQLTISLGLAALVPDSELRDSLVRGADEALLRAKTQGRDKICRSGPLANQPALGSVPVGEGFSIVSS